MLGIFKCVSVVFMFVWVMLSLICFCLKCFVNYFSFCGFIILLLLVVILIVEWIVECKEWIGVVVIGDGVLNGLLNVDLFIVGWSEVEIWFRMLWVLYVFVLCLWVEW